MGERTFLSWLRERFGTDDPSVLAGVGCDDCALLDVREADVLAVSTDTFVEGTHFRPEDPPRAVGWKALAASLSDLAASGCAPRWGLVAGTIRRGLGESWAREATEGIADCAATYDLRIVGGDTTSGAGPACLTTTVLGLPWPGGPVRRDGARAGDVICVTGTLGGSLAGRHLHPEPRLACIRRILQLVPVHAGMDLSDGLGLDLARLAEASGLGARLEADSVPVSEAACRLAAASGRSPLAHALHDGEDFELLLTLAPEDWERLRAGWTPDDGPPLTAVGVMEEAPGLRLREGGATRPLPPEGYEHDFDAGA